MRSSQIAVPLVAAALGSGITAAAMLKRDDGTSSMSVGGQPGVLTSNARLDDRDVVAAVDDPGAE